MNEEIYTGAFYWTTAHVELVVLNLGDGDGSSLVQARVIYDDAEEGE